MDFLGEAQASRQMGEQAGREGAREQTVGTQPWAALKITPYLPPEGHRAQDTGTHDLSRLAETFRSDPASSIPKPGLHNPISSQLSLGS